MPEVDKIEITVLMPCLNEAETLATCIHKAHLGCQKAGATYEILVADNGEFRRFAGDCRRGRRPGHRRAGRGDGAALQAGIRAARGQSIIMGDADDSYDFSEYRALCREVEPRL